MAADWLPGLPTTTGWFWAVQQFGFGTCVQIISETTSPTLIAPGLVTNGYSVNGTEKWYGPLDVPTPPEE